MKKVTERNALKTDCHGQDFRVTDSKSWFLFFVCFFSFVFVFCDALLVRPVLNIEEWVRGKKDAERSTELHFNGFRAQSGHMVAYGCFTLTRS